MYAAVPTRVLGVDPHCVDLLYPQSHSFSMGIWYLVLSSTWGRVGGWVGGHREGVQRRRVVLGPSAAAAGASEHSANLQQAPNRRKQHSYAAPAPTFPSLMSRCAMCRLAWQYCEAAEQQQGSGGQG